MYQYLDSQYLAWHIVAVESIKKLILNLDDFYSDITGENQPLSIVEHEQIKNEVRIGWIFEALSHAEQAIEDLFSFLMLSKNIPDLPEYKGVIAISFTNKASDELKRRCKQRCADTKQSFFGTIDKFCSL